MKRWWIRAQIAWVCVILLVTFGLLLNLVTRWNKRWDLTPDKIYSIAPATQNLLKEMQGQVEVIAFYPHDDPARANFEVFLRQCQMANPGFKYSFYDPDRVPSVTKKYNVREVYTVILSFQGRSERITQPTEQNFTNALVKLLRPKKLQVCFVTGHGEPDLKKKERNGYSSLAELLRQNNFDVQEIILSRDHVPASCQVVAVSGPHNDFSADEFKWLSGAFEAGAGILFMIDPMDAGQGKDFVSYFRSFGVALGTDVIVDKASRMVGGDFLISMVTQYVMQHPITQDFQVPTFFPVARSVQPAVDLPQGYDVVPLAVTSAESWAETNLAQLEKGEATFQSAYDLMGPISIAVAVDTAKPKAADPKGSKPSQSGGRLVVIGDSDFVTNGYIDLSGNSAFALSSIQWLSKDERMIMLRPRDQSFKPFLMNPRQKTALVLFAVCAVPGFFLLLGCVALFARRKSA